MKQDNNACFDGATGMDHHSKAWPKRVNARLIGIPRALAEARRCSPGRAVGLQVEDYLASRLATAKTVSMHYCNKVQALLTALVLITLAATSGLAGGDAEPVISVAGDLLGHLVGTVSRVEGTVAVKDAFIEVTGQTPGGSWKSTAKTDEQGVFRADLPLSCVGPVKITATAGGTIAERTVDSGDISRRLTPRPAKGSANRLSLDGQWGDRKSVV